MGGGLTLVVSQSSVASGQWLDASQECSGS